jgi:hypothetical protein
LFWNLFALPSFFWSAFSFSSLATFFFKLPMLNTDSSWQASTHLMTDLHAVHSKLFDSS